MPEDPKSSTPSTPEPEVGGPSAADARERAADKGISDLFRRAVAAGIDVAGRSKDDFVRIATNEIRDWLDRLELDTELRKALSKMVLEVKAEVRFRPIEGSAGDMAAETKANVHVRKAPKTEEP